MTCQYGACFNGPKLELAILTDDYPGAWKNEKCFRVFPAPVILFF
jgi:hypothetical protein